MVLIGIIFVRENSKVLLDLRCRLLVVKDCSVTPQLMLQYLAVIIEIVPVAQVDGLISDAAALKVLET